MTQMQCHSVAACITSMGVSLDRNLGRPLSCLHEVIMEKAPKVEVLSSLQINMVWDRNCLPELR
jgi:hypothetical protein